MRQPVLLFLALLAASGCGDRILADLRSDVGDAGQGTALGDMTFTYSWLVLESSFSGAADTMLYDESCNAIATVPNDFAAAVCEQGAGRLRSGTLVNYGSDCSCGYACPNEKICFEVVDPAVAPWGISSIEEALVPLRSLAASELTIGQTVFLPAWVGKSIPAKDGLGGWLHDGCFRMDDESTSDTGTLSLVAGSEALAKALKSLHPSGTTMAVWTSAPRCDYLAR
jgi:hypothetical protein